MEEHVELLTFHNFLKYHMVPKKRIVFFSKTLRDSEEIRAIIQWAVNDEKPSKFMFCFPNQILMSYTTGRDVTWRRDFVNDFLRVPLACLGSRTQLQYNFRTLRK